MTDGRKILDNLEGKHASAAHLMARVRGGRRPDAVAERERDELAGRGVKPALVRRLQSQAKTLKRAVIARHKVDAARAIVARAWADQRLPGEPPLRQVISQTTAADVLVRAGLDVERLAAALGTTEATAKVLRSRSVNGKLGGMTRGGAQREGPDPSTEVGLAELHAALKTLVERCRAVEAYATATFAAVTLIDSLEIVTAATHSQQTPAACTETDDQDNGEEFPDRSLEELAALVERSDLQRRRHHEK